MKTNIIMYFNSALVVRNKNIIMCSVVFLHHDMNNFNVLI